MAVDFVRSAFVGYWRFFAGQPDVLTGGAYYFVPNDTPHLPFLHSFGSDFWRRDPKTMPPGSPTPFKTGHDSGLPWKWTRGTPPGVRVPTRFVGDQAAFSDPATWPANPPVTLNSIGIDERCYVIPCGTLPLTMQLDDFQIDDCCFLYILGQFIQLMAEEDFPRIEQALRMWLGEDCEFAFATGVGDFPAKVVCKTPRNNLVLIYGTDSNRLLRAEILTSLGGPTNYPEFATLPIWWNNAQKTIDLMDTLAMDSNIPSYIVGHSLGAATAAVVTARLRLGNPDAKLRSVLFECPKPGDQRLADIINREIFVATANFGDIVPLIPPSNVYRSALQGVLPFIPNSWFDTWKPFIRYLSLQPDGEQFYTPIPETDVLDLVGFVVALFVTGQEGPISPHYMPNVLLRLAFCCTEIRCPFTDTFYNVLFGTTHIPLGGFSLNGGSGFFTVHRGAGFKLDGAGVLGLGVGSGAELDGGGVVGLGVGSGAELDGGGVLGLGVGSGFKIGGSGTRGVGTGSGAKIGGAGVTGGGTPVPATTCLGGGSFPFGSTFTHTLPIGPSNNWFQYAVTSGKTYTITLAAGTSGSITGTLLEGACASLITKVTVNSLTLTGHYTATSNTTGHMQISNSDVINAHSYTVTLTET